MTTIAPHLRLTAEGVKANWLAGHYTVSGYLHHLILAMKRQGWKLGISCVKKFCERWEIARSSFYRAIRHLEKTGQLESARASRLNLWIPTDKPDTLKVLDAFDPEALKILDAFDPSNLGDPANPAQPITLPEPDIPPPKAPDPPDEALVEFVIRHSPNARQPRAYALTCLKTDAQHWIDRFQEWQKRQQNPVEALPFGSTIEVPPAPALVPSPDRETLLGKAVGYINMGKSPTLKATAMEDLKTFMKANGISPEELQAYIDRHPQAPVVEVAHPLEVPKLKDSNWQQEQTDRLKAAQWQYFEQPKYKPGQGFG